MPVTARRPKAEAYEKGIREGTAMAKRSRGSKPAEEEEMDMGMMPGHSRKRRKPAADGYGMKKPMDGGMYGKKPMDAECGCGKKKGRKCDGSCGSMRKRSDSLTPQEYLTACEMGIQDRSATYIRARLDTAEARNDLKCGKGAISEGEKCTKGPATKVKPKKGNKGPIGRLKAFRARGRAADKTWERRYGKQPKASNKNKLKALGVTTLAVGAGVGAAVLVNRMPNRGSKPTVPFNLGNMRAPKPGAINKPGTASGLLKAADRGRLNELESLARGNNPALEAQMQVSKARNTAFADVKNSLKRSRAELQRLRTEIGVWGPNRIKPFKRKRRDSIWADSFAPNPEQLAI